MHNVVVRISGTKEEALSRTKVVSYLFTWLFLGSGFLFKSDLLVQEGLRSSDKIFEFKFSPQNAVAFWTG